MVTTKNIVEIYFIIIIFRNRTERIRAYLKSKIPKKRESF